MSILNVTGPHNIQWATGATGHATLGRADNDDLFNIEMEYKYSDIQTNEFGTMPANSILMGATAFVNFTLVQYDASAITAMFNAMNGSGSNGIAFPSVGVLISTGSTSTDQLVSIKVTPSIAGRPTYQVDNLRLISHNLRDVGNKPTRAAFRFEVLPVTANRTIYTVS